jgi:eukaryotic-like serine/threonine-protein kinase
MRPEEQPFPPVGEVRPVELPEGFLLDGRFRILGQIGSGGVGAVFEAEQLALGRRVAIKLIHPALARVAEVAARFKREATALAAVESPHVVAVIDVGESPTPEGRLPWLAMELLRGDTVATLLGGGRLPIGEAVRIADGALAAMAAVHRLGMVHRDFKPENLFVTRSRTVKLVDFGLSRWLAESSPSRLTRAGFTLGTPNYMAPEQATGDPAADQRVDVFAMGVTLYELLTGKVPFDGPNYAVVLTRVLQGKPVPPRQLRREIPEALEAAVLRALEKKPGRRFAGAAEFRAAIAPFLAGEPSPEIRDCKTVIVPRPSGHAPLALLAAATGLLLFAAAVGGRPEPPAGIGPMLNHATDRLRMSPPPSRSPGSGALRRGAVRRPGAPPAPARSRTARLREPKRRRA